MERDYSCDNWDLSGEVGSEVIVFNKAERSVKWMCIYEPLHGEMPIEANCKNGCEECPFNVPDIPKPENEQDELPY